MLNIFRVPDLRRKVLVTLALLVVYRLGAHIPTPFIDTAAVEEALGGLFTQQGGGVFGVVDMFSGGAFSQMTIFALGIMPYISASIIIQLLTAVWPRLEKISKEGEAGRKKITQYTRYSTVGLAFFQGLGLGVWMLDLQVNQTDNRMLFLFVTALTMCTGTCFIMWLGEKMTQHGIGNGISLIIAAGIIARYPLDVRLAFLDWRNDQVSMLGLILLAALTVVVAGVIVINQVSNRRVPIQHAQRMVGHKVMRGGNTYIPLKLNTAGVIPVIFSSAILSFPAMLLPYLGGAEGGGGIGASLANWLSPASPHNPYDAFNMSQGGIFLLLKVLNLYTLLYIVLTGLFCFFYTAITLNPVDLADNLKKSNAFIPGIKPGKHTADYIDFILMRITVVGAAILIAIALVPDVLHVSFGFNFNVANIAGGTGLIIVVGVVLDTMKQIESQLMMRHYEGFKFGAGGTAGRGGRRPVVRARRPTGGS